MSVIVNYLTARYPITFTRHATVEAVPTGWHRLVSRLVHGLFTVLGPEPEHRIILKSVGLRSGGLHVTYGFEPQVGDGAPVTFLVDGVVAAIRRRSLHTCDACGAPGKLRLLSQGLHVVRCESHADGGSRTGAGQGALLLRFEEWSLDAPGGFVHAACSAFPEVFVDLVGMDEVPPGWRGACRDLFADVAAFMRGAPGRRLELHRLHADGDQLSWDIVLPPSVPAIVASAIHSTFLQTARDLERTCRTCGLEHDPNGCTASTASGGSDDPDPKPRSPGPRRTPTKKPFQPLVPRLPAVADQPARPKPPSIEAAIVPGEHIFDKAIYRRRDVANALGIPTHGLEGPDLTISSGFDDEGPSHGDHHSRLTRILESGEAGRWRKLVGPTDASILAVEALAGASPHLSEVIGFVVRHLRAADAIGLPIRLPPTLLVGPPGIGKTWLLTRIAAAFGVPHRVHLMNVSTTSDGIGGAHPVWRNASPGLLARTLLAEEVANPIFLVDEFDKAHLHGGLDAFGPFYTLLEPVGASTFVDDYLQFPIDASAVSWVMSANDVDLIPDPIRDRLTIFDLPLPSAEHLAAVVDSIYGEANAANRGFFAPSLDPRSRSLLTKHAPRSIRVMIEDAMVRAAAQKRREISIQDIVPRKGAGRSPIGFLRGEV